jgi:hypothetical protein
VGLLERTRSVGGVVGGGVHDCGALNAVWRKCGKPTWVARPVCAATAAPRQSTKKGLRAGVAEIVAS